jgi:hypothetical protein
MSAWTLSGFGEPLPADGRLPLLCAAALGVWLTKRGLVPGFSLPESRRQIPAEVFGGGLARGALRFGFELGTGFRTYVPALAPYVLLLVLLIGRPTVSAALLIGLGFGFGRAVPIAFQFASPRGREPGAAAPPVPAMLTSPATALLILAGAMTLV